MLVNSYIFVAHLNWYYFGRCSDSLLKRSIYLSFDPELYSQVFTWEIKAYVTPKDLYSYIWNSFMLNSQNWRQAYYSLVWNWIRKLYILQWNYSTLEINQLVIDEPTHQLMNLRNICCWTESVHCRIPSIWIARIAKANLW